MYSTCLFCQGSLGRNERIEHFPVGRRLAFDVAKGRLWAVCPTCSRWNLTPLEERWEAIEECERLFRTVRPRAVTDNVAVAEPPGVRLVRVGRVERRELDVWRYARRMRIRQVLTTSRSAARYAGAYVAFGAAAFTLGMLPAYGVMVGGGFALGMVEVAFSIRQGRRPAVAVVTESGDPVVLTNRELRSAALIARDDEHGWGARVFHGRDWMELPSPAALGVLRAAAARSNADGAPTVEVEIASGWIGQAGSAERYFTAALADIARGDEAAERAAAFHPDNERPAPSTSSWVRGATIASLDRLPRLALDMALTERTEDAALRGELAALETAWRDAEEIAAIADGLLVPNAVERKLTELRDR